MGDTHYYVFFCAHPNKWNCHKKCLRIFQHWCVCVCLLHFYFVISVCLSNVKTSLSTRIFGRYAWYARCFQFKIGIYFTQIYHMKVKSVMVKDKNWNNNNNKDEKNNNNNNETKRQRIERCTYSIRLNVTWGNFFLNVFSSNTV